MFSISQPCSRCGGRGAVVDDPCPTCGGAGRTQETKRFRVKVPAGVREGSRIRLAGKGEPGSRRGPGRGPVRGDPRDALAGVQARGEDLEVDVPSTIVEALRGGTVEVPTLEGTKRIRVAPGTADGSLQRLRGEGPAKLSGSGRGDIRYRFKVQIPTSLTSEQQEAVDRLSEVMNGDPRADLMAQARREV